MPLSWIGLSEAALKWGKDRLGSISKQGDRYLRSLFVAGALAVIRYAKIHGTKHRPWLTAFGAAPATARITIRPVAAKLRTVASSSLT
jgi:transposase